MTLILTCTHCATVREAPPHEQYQAPGTQTQAHCRTCDRITAHWFSVPVKMDGVTLEFERRAGR